MADLAARPMAGVVTGRPGQPKALFYIAMVEIWERFATLGLRAILIFYLLREHFFAEEGALAVYAGYAALCTFTIVLGGVIADRLMGARRTIVCGAVLMMLGCGSLVVSTLHGLAVALPAMGSLRLEAIYLGLTLTAIGSGLLKCSATAMVGRSYRPGDPARQMGFTLYYTGTNIGSGLAAAICGFFGEVYGWTLGFGLAAIGVACGLAIFLGGHAYYHDAIARDPGEIERRRPGRRPFAILLITGLITATFCLLHSAAVFRDLLSASSAVVVGYVAFVVTPRLPANERDGMWACFKVLISSQVFWLLYVLTGGAVALFIAAAVNRKIAGFVMPPSTFQSLEPLLSVAIGPAIAWYFARLARTGKRIGNQFKLGSGLIAAAVAYTLLGGAGLAAAGPNEVSIAVIFLYFLALTIADMVVAPTALSALSALAPLRLVSTTIGLYYLCAVFAHLFAAWITARALAFGQHYGWDEGHALSWLFLALAGVGWLGAAPLLIRRRGSPQRELPV